MSAPEARARPVPVPRLPSGGAPGRVDRGFGPGRRLDHRDHHPLDADIEHPFQIRRVVGRYPDDRVRVAGGLEPSDRRLDVGQGRRGVLGVDERDLVPDIGWTTGRYRAGLSRCL